jgi:hypothetical protein
MEKQSHSTRSNSNNVSTPLNYIKPLLGFNCMISFSINSDKYKVRMLQNNPTNRLNWEEFFEAINSPKSEQGSLAQQKYSGLIKGLEDMGIIQERAKFVVYASQAKTLESAISWFVKCEIQTYKMLQVSYRLLMNSLFSSI